MQTTTNTTNITRRTFEGIPVSLEGIDKIKQQLDRITHIIGYPSVTDDDILDGVNDLLQTITEYGYGDAVSVAIKHIITASNGKGRRGRDISFMIDVIVHTLIISPVNNIYYQVINFDLAETNTSEITKHYNSPLVDKLFESISNLPGDTTIYIIAGLGDFLDNVYYKYKYHSTDITKSGNIITHVNYDALPDDTTNIMVHNKEVSIDLKQITKRMRQHDLSDDSCVSINAYIRTAITRKQRQLKEISCPIIRIN